MAKDVIREWVKMDEEAGVRFEIEEWSDGAFTWSASELIPVESIWRGPHPEGCHHFIGETGGQDYCVKQIGDGIEHSFERARREALSALRR
jgi:hypothetical protein